MPLREYVRWRRAQKYQPQPEAIFRAAGFHENDWRRVEHEYGRMAAFAESIAARLVISHIPQKGPWTEKHRYPAARLSSWARNRNISFVDTLPAMERASLSERLYYDKDGHCTAAGHAVIAGELFKHLTELHIVP